MLKLRIAGIITFLLYMVSAFVGFQVKSNYYFSQIQQILILVSLVIFVILILLQGYAFYTNNFVNKEEEEI